MSTPIKQIYTSNILTIDVQRVDIDGDYFPTAMYLSVLDVDAEIQTKKDPTQKTISYLSLQSVQDIADNNIEVSEVSYTKNIVKIIEIDPKQSSQIFSNNKRHEAGLLPRLLQLPTEGVNVVIDLNNEKSIISIYNSIYNALKQAENNLNEKSSKYSSLSEKLAITSSGLESRLLSSTALFSVISFRASLIVIVFVSIGFILIRALSAELAQARRLSTTQIGHSIINSTDITKLPYVEQIVSVVSGDNTNKKSSPSDLPLAAQLVEKTGDAIEKTIARRG